MKKLKYLLVLLVSIFLGLMLIANTSQAKILKVGLLFREFHTDRWQHDRYIFSQIMKNEDIRLYSFSARGSEDLQVAQISQLIQDGVDALVIVPVDGTSKKLSAVLKRAKEHNIILMAYDQMIDKSYINAYVGVDSKDTIKAQAGEILNITTKGNYIFILNSKDQEFHNTLNEAFDFYRKQTEKKYKINTYVIDSSNIHGVLDNLLIKLKYKVSGIFAYDDNVASKAISILHKNNIYSVYVAGMNATANGVIHILSGSQYSTIYRDIASEATIAGSTIVALLKKNKLPKAMNLVSANKYSSHIPTWKKPSTYITKGNIGFLTHNKQAFSDRILRIIHAQVDSNNNIHSP